MPGIRLDGEPSRLRSNFINGIKHMPVRFYVERENSAAVASGWAREWRLLQFSPCRRQNVSASRATRSL